VPFISLVVRLILVASPGGFAAGALDLWCAEVRPRNASVGGGGLALPMPESPAPTECAHPIPPPFSHPAPSYRASKAALNSAIRSAALELRGRGANVALLLLHPGTVSTDLTAPFVGTDPRPGAQAVGAAATNDALRERAVEAGRTIFSVQRGATQLIALCDSAGTADSGRFVDWRGEDVPW